MRVFEGLADHVSRHRITTSFVLGVPAAVLAEPTGASIALGLLPVAAGAALRIWSSGCIEKGVSLTLCGPYALSRHPLYFGNFLLGLGFAIMTNRLWIVLVYVGLFAFIYDATIENEERKLSEKFGLAFERYARSVPRFFPRLKVPSFSGFDWQLVRRHQEERTWAAIVGLLLFFVIRAR